MWSVCVRAAVAASMLWVASWTQASPLVSAGSAVVGSGATFTIDISVKDTVDLTARQFSLTFDPQAELALDSEIDYGRPESNDYGRLTREHADVLSMTLADLDAIVCIDRCITGRDQREYMSARLDEAIVDSSARVQLAARCDGSLVGYLMTRADLGHLSRSAPLAVIDTLGVGPDYAHRGIGHAPLRELVTNLGALHIERVETIVPLRDLALTGCLYGVGFQPAQRLSLVRRLAGKSG